jgi:hypothetical protein
MKWALHVAQMGKKRNVYRLLVGKPEGNRPLGRPRRRCFFLNPISFANCTVTFSKWCVVVEACRGELSSTPPYRTGSKPRVSVGNKSKDIGG